MPNHRRAREARSAARALALGGALLLAFAPAAPAQDPPTPSGRPPFFGPVYRSVVRAPLPLRRGAETLPGTIPADGSSVDPSGRIGFHSDAGPAATRGAGEHPFFAALGTNGRSCGTCHQPSQGMGLGALQVRGRFLLFGVNHDPLFAPVDGANCPNQVPNYETAASLVGSHFGRGADSAKARSLLLKDGLIRVFLPVPATRDFEVAVSADPYTCNTDPLYAQDPASPATKILSFYRRPLISASLAAKTEALVFGPPPAVGATGNIMWDGREPSLESQAVDATFGHAQRDSRPPPEGQGPLSASDQVIKDIVAYEKGFFSAQQRDSRVGALDQNGAAGGAQNLAAALTPSTNILPNFTSPPFDEFAAWEAGAPGGGEAKARRDSIGRGEVIFNARSFDIAGVAGFSDVVPPDADGKRLGTCATCHNGNHSGGDVLAANQRNIGTTGDTLRGQPLRADLPVFTVTCTGPDHLFNGHTLKTNDLGAAMITGRCLDAGKVTVPQMRGLASRAPYFHDGSADTLDDVVAFYDKRFGIGLTARDRRDLANFLAAL